MKSVVLNLMVLLLLPLIMIFSVWSASSTTETSESFVESRITNIACYAQTDSLVAFEECVSKGKVYKDGELVLVDKTRIRQVYQEHLDKYDK